MPTSYMSLTNRLLRRLNEVEIRQSDFSSVRGVQAMAKDAIVASVNEIYETELEWPFNSGTGSQLLVIGQEEYSWPADLKVVNWNSFNVVEDSILNVNTTHLLPISTDQWNKFYRQIDEDAGSDGVSLPSFVFKGHGMKFGVTPSPDKAYTVEFNYWKYPASIVNYADVTTIPTVYDEAIIQGGLYHYYMFRDNLEQAREAGKKFSKMVSNMRTILINTQEAVQGNRYFSNPKGLGNIAIPVDGYFWF